MGAINKMFPEIQRFLTDQGCSLAGKPRYRLVWSDNEYELRAGTFDEYSGNIFLRTVTGVKRVRKYPFLHSRWVFEKYFPPEVAYTESLPESRSGSYEPLFVFQDKHQNPLPVTLKVVEVLVAFDRRSRANFTQRASEDKALQELAETKEFEQILDSIDTTAIQSLLHTKEAIVRP